MRSCRRYATAATAALVDSGNSSSVNTICRVDALADATVDAIIGAYGEQHKSLVDERVHQLASATAEAALDALEEVDRASLAVERDVRAAKIRSAEEIWDGA